MDGEQLATDLINVTASYRRKMAWAKAWKRAAKQYRDKTMEPNPDSQAQIDTIVALTEQRDALKAKIEALPAVIRDLCGGQDVQPWFMEQVKKALGEHFNGCS